jgi:molecular chaperone DnaK (HSP70)
MTDHGYSFKSIDPTACHQSAHPIPHESTVAFKIKDKEDDTENVVTVSEITTRHLRKLKNSASDYLGKNVNAAVLTVPTNFSDAQKDALSKAAKDAGIEVLQFINEPVAAVLAYDARPEAKLADKNIIVADLGGTRSDVAVIASRGGMYSILATAHDYDVGGAQLDQVVMDYFAKEFLKKWKNGGDPRVDDRASAKLRLESEAVKKALSIGSSANFSVESLSKGFDFTCSINRMRYETISSKVFAAFTRLILGVVEKAQLDPLDISEIILAGGTAHTPRIASSIASTFPESTTVLAPSTSPTAINPSELAARGAAIQASLIQEFESEDIEQSTHPMVTVTPHMVNAIGVLCISSDESTGVFRHLVEAETPVPVRRTAIIATPREGGDILVKICEGTRVIKVTNPEPKKANGNADKGSDDEEDSDDESDEEEELREKTYKIEKVLAEVALKGLSKGAKVELQINVAVDLSCTFFAREVGGKAAVRGGWKAPAKA